LQPGRIDPDQGCQAIGRYQITTQRCLNPPLPKSRQHGRGGASVQSYEIGDRDREENHNGTQNEIALSSGHSAPLERLGMATFNVGLFPDSPTSDSSIHKARLEILSDLQADDVSDDIVLFVVRKSDVRHCGMRRLKPYAQGRFRHSWRACDIGKCGRL